MWFYRYEENESNPDAEPSLSYIDNDEEYETVADAFDEYLDNVEFDEIVGSDKNEEETSSKNKEENPLLAESSPHFSSKNKEDNQ